MNLCQPLSYFLWRLMGRWGIRQQRSFKRMLAGLTGTRLSAALCEVRGSPSSRSRQAGKGEGQEGRALKAKAAQARLGLFGSLLGP